MAARTTPATARLAAMLCLALVSLPVVLGLAASPAFANSGQWQLAALNLSSAWRSSTGNGVIVAVLDSGVDATHPDLSGQVLPGVDMVDGSTGGRRDPVGHGTSIAALIAGHGSVGGGATGVAPRAKILPVRVLDKNNKYQDAATVAAGLHWAVDHGAKVINMSLGSPNRSAALAAAIQYAYAHDAVIVACTGNVDSDAASGIWYPAREPGVVAVAGLAEGTDPAEGSYPADASNPAGESNPAGDADDRDPDDPEAGTQVTWWSGGITGSGTVLTAPAADLYAAKPGGYWHVEGTSFAAALVTGSAALIRAKWPGMNAANVVNRLVRTARDLGAPGRDDRYGYGEVDPARALSVSLPNVSRNPLLPAVVPPDSGSHAAEQAGGGAPVPTPEGRDAPLATGTVPDTRRSPMLLLVGVALVTGVAGSGAALMRHRFGLGPPAEPRRRRTALRSQHRSGIA